jgi:hypothetical protein
MLGLLQLRPEVVRRKENVPSAAKKISETGPTVGNGPLTPKGTTKVLSKDKLRRTGISHAE